MRALSVALCGGPGGGPDTDRWFGEVLDQHGQDRDDAAALALAAAVAAAECRRGRLRPVHLSVHRGRYHVHHTGLIGPSGKDTESYGGGM